MKIASSRLRPYSQSVGNYVGNAVSVCVHFLQNLRADGYRTGCRGQYNVTIIAHLCMYMYTYAQALGLSLSLSFPLCRCPFLTLYAIPFLFPFLSHSNTRTSADNTHLIAYHFHVLIQVENCVCLDVCSGPELFGQLV